MKAIIFGCTGQDGSHLADLLIAKGYQVIGVARYASTDNTARLKHLTACPQFQIETGDITDSNSVRGVLAKHSDVNEV